VSDIWWIIWLSAGFTYFTRFAGHLLLQRVERIPPRIEAALNAVPAAVITTIVAPVLVTGDWPERIAILVAGVLSLRLPVIAVVAIGTGLVAGARALGF
jgi:uncharacterized membrane protein